MAQNSHRYKFSGILLFLIVVCSVFGVSQRADTMVYIHGEGYIEKMNEHIGLKVSLDNGFETFKVSTDANDVILYPNFSTVSKFGIQYRFIRFSLGWAPKFFPGNGDDDIKGTTDSFDFGISMFFKHWLQELKYTTVQGFYLANTEDYQPWEPGDPYLQFPDLAYTGFYGTSAYILNPRLSIKSLTIQTERQLKSAGSFLAFLNYRYYIVDDQSKENPGSATQRSDGFEWNIGPGYYYTFVMKKKFYAALGAISSLGMILTKVTTRFPSGNVYAHQHNIAFRWDTRAGFGYNGRIFFSGVYLQYSGLEYKQENTTAVNHETRAFFQFFAGFRIKLPDKVNGFFDKYSF